MIGIGISLTLIYKKKSFIFASFLPRFIRCRFLQIGHIINLSTLYHGRIIRIQGKDDLIHAEYVFQRRILKEILIFRIIIRSALILLLQKVFILLSVYILLAISPAFSTSALIL